MPISSILQGRFKPGSKNYVRATNLEYYYKGYLNYGCHYDKTNGVEVQKFDYTSRSREIYPEFECSIAEEGCRSDDGCHYVVGVWCTCRGKTYVRLGLGETNHTELQGNCIYEQEKMRLERMRLGNQVVSVWLLQ